MSMVPPEFGGTLLVSYKGASGTFVNLREIPEQDLRESIFSDCPEPSESFSPPVIYE